MTRKLSDVSDTEVGLLCEGCSTRVTLRRVQQSLVSLHTKVDKTMAQVRVNSEDLEALDTSLDEVATALANKINGLALPEGDLAPLLADVETLRGLSAPAANPAE